MKCNKSFKREMLVHWGIRQLQAGGTTLESVQKEIGRMMKKTTEEVKAFVDNDPLAAIVWEGVTFRKVGPRRERKPGEKCAGCEYPASHVTPMKDIEAIKAFLWCDVCVEIARSKIK